MRTRRRTAAGSPRRSLPQIECLEDRACPAVSAVLSAPDTLVLLGNATGHVVNLNIDREGTVNGSVVDPAGAAKALAPRAGIQNLVIRTRGRGGEFHITQSTPGSTLPLLLPLRIVSNPGAGPHKVNLVVRDDIAGTLKLELRGDSRPDELKVRFDGDILFGADVDVDLHGGRGADTLTTENNGDVNGRLVIDSKGGRGSKDILSSTLRGNVGATGAVAVNQQGGPGNGDRLTAMNDARATIGGSVAFAGNGGDGAADEVTLIGCNVLADAVFMQEGDGGAGDGDMVTCRKEAVRGVAICNMNGGPGKNDVLNWDVTDIRAGGNSLTEIRAGRGYGKMVDGMLRGTLDGTARFQITGATGRRGRAGDAIRLDLSDLDGGTGTLAGAVHGSPGDDSIEVKNSNPVNMASLNIPGIQIDGGSGTNVLTAPGAWDPLIQAGLIRVAAFQKVTLNGPFPTTITFDAGQGAPLSYTESGLTVISRYPFGGPHLHMGDQNGDGSPDLLNHSGPSSTPYEFTFGGAPFTVVSVRVVSHMGTTAFTSSTGAVMTPTASATGASTMLTAGTVRFPSEGWTNITSFRWDQSAGQTIIDDLMILVQPAGAAAR